jgi:hypothetical protein
MVLQSQSMLHLTSRSTIIQSPFALTGGWMQLGHYGIYTNSRLTVALATALNGTIAARITPG